MQKLSVGEAPGETEDETDRPFVGKAGQLLDNILKAANLRREDVFIMNILKCRPPRNRTPLPIETSNCRPYLDLQLKIINPKYIVCLGNVAAQNLLGRDDSISSLRGQLHNYKNAKVICTYHPSYVLREGDFVKKQIWEDMQLLLKEMDGNNEE